MSENKRISGFYLNEKRLVHFIIWIGILLPTFVKAGTPRLPRLFIQIMAMMLLLITLLYCLRKDKHKQSYYNLIINSLDILVISFVILSAFSTFMVSYGHNAQSCFLLVVSFAIFYFHISGYFSIKNIEKLLWALIGLGILESAIGFYQAFFLSHTRITGTFYNSNHLASFLACLSMFLFARMIFNRPFRKKYVLKIIIILFLVSALFLTRSRGGILALIGGGIGFIPLINKKKIAFSFMIAALVLLLLIPNPVINRLKQVQINDVYAYSRFSMWKSALSMLRDHPLFGIGIGNFEFYSYRYAFPVEKAWARYARVARYAHNELLHLGAEMGIPGILFFLAAIFTVFIKDFKKRRNTGVDNNSCSTHPYHADEKAILIVILTLLFHSIVDFIFHIPAILFVLIIFVAWISKIRIIDNKNNHFRFNFTGKGIRLILFVCLIIPIVLVWIPIREYLGYVSFNKAHGNDPLADIKYIENAVSMDFGCAPYHNSLGGAYFKLYGKNKDTNFLDQGLSEAQIAQTLNPDDHRFPLSLGLGYLNIHSIFPEKTDILKEAEKEFRKCLMLAPYLYEGFLGLGRTLLYQDRLKDALNAFEAAVRLEPYSMSSHYWLGLTLDTLGEIESARSEYKKILAIKRLNLEKKAYITYEKELIDFDVSKLYPRLKAYDDSLLK
ncbi:MAG: O-antigen ligase family protein [bacterium]